MEYWKMFSGSPALPKVFSHEGIALLIFIRRCSLRFSHVVRHEVWTQVGKPPLAVTSLQDVSCERDGEIHLVHKCDGSRVTSNMHNVTTNSVICKCKLLVSYVSIPRGTFAYTNWCKLFCWNPCVYCD
jgi:hypothetical protein